MTSMQEGMLFHSEWEAQGAVYHDIVGLHLKAPYERASLERALKDAMAAHPILRTAFDLQGFSRPLQLVYREAVLECGEESIRHLVEEGQRAEVLEWMEREKRRGFVWNRQPLIRFYVHRRSGRSFHFSISFHHSLLDGWSTANLLVEVFRRYFFYIGRSNHPLPEAPKSLVRDYVVMEDRERNWQEARSFWRSLLEEAPQTLCLGTLRGNQLGDGSSNVIRLELKFPALASKKAMALSRELGIPLKSVLLAAHLNVVSLITGNRDLVTGLISNGRLDQTDGDRVLGLFLNTLPFRFEGQEGTWKEALLAIFAREADCIRYRRYPLADLSQQLQASDLFNTAFNFVHYHVYDDLERLEGVEVLDSTGFEQTSFTLLANFSYSGSSQALSLYLDCDAACLSQKQIQLIQGYYIQALNLLTDAPDAPFDPRLLLAEGERERLLGDWADGPGTPFPVSRLERLVEAQADQKPDAVAVVSGRCQVSYRELNRRANRLAWHLRGQGIAVDDAIGVSLRRSIDLMVACLAILKAGAAFCCLDQDLPEQRLALMAADARVRVILAEGDRPLPFVEPDGCQILRLSEAEGAIERQPTKNLTASGGLEHLCYVIYTSGSTGVPKGIAMTHRVLSELISWQLGEFVSSCPARVLQYTALSFDVSFQEIFSTWAQGGSLVLMSEEMRGHPQRLWERLVIHEVERLFVPFAGLKQLSDISEGNPKESLALKEIITAGEQLRITPEIQGFFEKHPGTAFWNQYGPAETHVVTSGRLHESIGQWPRLPDIGRPVAKASVYILDSDLQPAPAGVRGELYLGGSMARSYLNQAGLTAGRFIPHPFAAQGERLYRTGDWGRFLEDGAIEFLGRRDHQVKVLGYRVELGEVEAVLAQHPSIKDIAVLAVAPHSGEKGLAAYYVPHGDRPPSAAELRQFAGVRLPAYMIPSCFVDCKAFPRTTGGKIDRMRLAQTPLGKGRTEQPIVDPASDTERRLLVIWKRVLALDSLGVEHDFFELGGHSLAATRISVSIRNAFEVDFPLRAIFEARTVRALSERIDGLLDASFENQAPSDELALILKRLDT
ncbi:MAG: amino acid adenylation domain-containing protein, partial [Acidobacteriota bacterium]